MMEEISLWRSPDHDRLEATRSVLVRHAFGRHLHDALVIGVVDAGQGRFWCEGRTHRCGRDSVVLIGPGQVHTGQPAAGTVLRYRNLYLGSALLAELDPSGAALEPTEHAPVDSELAALIRALTDRIRSPEGALDLECRLVGLLERIDARSHRAPPRPRSTREPRAVRESLAYLDAHAVENVSLVELAEVVGLHPAYLSRVFSRAVGLPPHAYLVQLRLHRAKALLAAGIPAATAALATGFYDQSHLTRHFRRAFGLPPGHYQTQALRAA